jgi:hypothetical protein
MKTQLLPPALEGNSKLLRIPYGDAGAQHTNQLAARNPMLAQ